MDVANTEAPKEGPRRENFPIDSFRFLEAKLQEIRKMVMHTATEIANRDCRPDAEICNVGVPHVRQALLQSLSNSDALMQAVGLAD